MKRYDDLEKGYYYVKKPSICEKVMNYLNEKLNLIYDEVCKLN